MSFFPHLPARIDDFTAAVKAALDSLFRRAAGKLAELCARLTEKLPPEKRRPVLMVSMGVCVVFALVFAGIPLFTRVKPAEQQPAGNTVTRQGIIPPDDLFLPDEPDFVPGVLLERNQRTVWTAADAASLWQDPLKNGEEPWRNRIEKTIDEIMESVP